MPAHAEAGTKQIRLAVGEAPGAAAVWRAQRALRVAGGGGHERRLAERVIAAQAVLGGRVFRVPDAELGELRRRIERLDRRARKLGAAPIRLLDTGERDGTASFVVLCGKAPRLAGWTLAAIVSHRDHQTSLRPVGIAGEYLHAARFAGARCEHCGLRRQRAETFVVTRERTGEVIQVGSGCVRDFVGGHDPERACRQAEDLALAHRALSDVDDVDRPATSARGENGERTADRAPTASPKSITIDEFAPYAANVIRAHGWTSRTQARRSGHEASGDRALRIVHEQPDAPSAADRALAIAALRWARTLWPTKSSLTAFEREALAAVNDNTRLGPRERGLVCALLAGYRRQRARARHLGTVGQSVTVTVLVERTTPQASKRHPALRRHDLLDADANRLVWWQTDGASLPDARALTVRGRVQRHSTFAGRPVTVLGHCRVTAREHPSNLLETSPRAAGT